MEKEAIKDGSRIAVFGAVSVLITYALTLPDTVEAAIVVLVLAGLTYIDSQIHRSDSKFNGLLPF